MMVDAYKLKDFMIKLGHANITPDNLQTFFKSMTKDQLEKGKVEGVVCYYCTVPKDEAWAYVARIATANSLC